jgi:diguanylate cyclase (GGDEF)-like protein
MAGPSRRAHPLHRRWSNLSLRAKGVVVVALPLAALTVSALAFSTTRFREQRADEATRRAIEVRTATRVTLVTLLDLESSVRGYLLTREAEFLEPAAEVRAEIPARLARLDALVRDGGKIGAAVTRIGSLAERRVEIAESLIEAPPPERAGLLRQGKAVMDLLREEINVVLARQNRAVITLQHEADRYRRITTIGIPLTVGFGLLGGLAGILLFTSGVVRRVRSLNASTDHLVSGEPLHPLPPGDDEIGKLGRAMQATSLRLQQMQRELRQQALFDDLTGLRNRRGFLNVAEQQLLVADRSGTPLAVMYADLDGMKAINDRFGHGEGDRALVDAAKVLRMTLRSADVIARLGGDEFCALLVDCPPEAGTMIADRIREQIERHNASADRPYHLSLSIGLAFARHATDIEELLGRADRSMYLDKAGRT